MSSFTFFTLSLLVYIVFNPALCDALNYDEIQLKMAKEFCSKYNASHLVIYFNGNDDLSWLKSWHKVMKNNDPLGYFNANNLNSPKSNKGIIDPWQSLFTEIVSLHLYIHHDFQHVKRLLANENANFSNSNTAFNSSTDIWLIRIPEQIENNGTIEILKGIKVKKTTKIFYFCVHGNHNINVYDSIQMHGNFPSNLSLHSTWTLSKGFQSLEKSIWSTPRSLDGLNIRVVSAYSPPSVTLIEDGCTSGDCFKGIFADVWHTLSEQMNFTYTIKRAYKWGSLANGSWDGMVGMLKNGIVDVAAADLTVSSERSEVVEFLPSLMEVTEELYMKNPGDTFTFVSYIGSFTNLSWLAIASWIIFVPIFIYAMLSRKICKNEERLTLVDSYAFVASSLINIGYALMSSKDCVRITIATVVIGGTLIYYHWEAELTSNLAFKKPNLPINNLKELSENQQFKFVVAQGTVYLDYFKYSNDPIKSKIWRDKLEPYFNDLPLLEQIEYRILDDAFTIAYSDSITKMTSAYLNCKIIDIKPPIRNTQLAFATQKEFPLYQTFKHHLNNVKQVGLVQKYIRNYRIDAQSCRDFDGKSVTIQQCFSAFQILAGGMLISLFGFGIEMILSFGWQKMNILFFKRSGKPP